MSYKILPATKPIRVWTHDLAAVEEEAHNQLINTSRLPWVEDIAVMPDVHYGLGATVGSVIKSRGLVSPAVVGVDIGCGMMAIRTTVDINDLHDFRALRHSIERSIPVGFSENKEVTDRVAAQLADVGVMSDRAKTLEKKAAYQLGTLGGGNHFVEVCIDEQNLVWLMLHSGSRGIGNQLARQHLEVAKGEMGEMLKSQDIDPELSALVEDSLPYREYMYDLHWCQRYAMANRTEMMVRVLKDFSHHMWKEDRMPLSFTNLAINCHHNYIEEAEGALITRKGAVSAKKGEIGIIPGSMGAKSFIVKGKGNPDSHCSCSHGAGRRMSRNKAKKLYTTEDVLKQTEGVECRKDAGVIDEIPGAYKDIDEVMRNQADLVEIVATLKQIICVKG
jgi:tRNA-splicing ligase RtcB